MRPEDMSRQIDEWASAVHRKAEQYQALKQEIAEISSEATGANGAIRVEVGPSGLLVCSWCARIRRPRRKRYGLTRRQVQV